MNQLILSRKAVFKGHAFNVQELSVQLPDRRIRTYDMVAHHDSVTIVPLDSQNNIWFVTQFRMGSESTLLELPAGVIESGEEPLQCAFREIREEIGLAAGKMTRLGGVYLAPGYSNELNHIYLATELTDNPLAADDDEFLGKVKFPQDQIDQLVMEGDLLDSKSISALYLMKLFLSK